jgi:hypothetical protein
MRKETAAACRAAAEKARRKDRPREEEAAVEKWKATGDPEAAAYQMRLQEERMELFQMQETEENCFLWGWEDSTPGCDEEAVEAGRYRGRWNPKRGTYEDTSKHTVRISSIQIRSCTLLFSCPWIF